MAAPPPPPSTRGRSKRGPPTQALTATAVDVKPRKRARKDRRKPTRQAEEPPSAAAPRSLREPTTRALASPVSPPDDDDNGAATDDGGDDGGDDDDDDDDDDDAGASGGAGETEVTAARAGPVLYRAPMPTVAKALALVTRSFVRRSLKVADQLRRAAGIAKCLLDLSVMIPQFTLDERFDERVEALVANAVDPSAARQAVDAWLRVPRAHADAPIFQRVLARLFPPLDHRAAVGRSETTAQCSGDDVGVQGSDGEAPDDAAAHAVGVLAAHAVGALAAKLVDLCDKNASSGFKAKATQCVRTWMRAVTATDQAAATHTVEFAAVVLAAAAYHGAMDQHQHLRQLPASKCFVQTCYAAHRELEIVLHTGRRWAQLRSERETRVDGERVSVHRREPFWCPFVVRALYSLTLEPPVAAGVGGWNAATQRALAPVLVQTPDCRRGPPSLLRGKLEPVGYSTLFEPGVRTRLALLDRALCLGRLDETSVAQSSRGCDGKGARPDGPLPSARLDSAVFTAGLNALQNLPRLANERLRLSGFGEFGGGSLPGDIAAVRRLFERIDCLAYWSATPRPTLGESDANDDSGDDGDGDGGGAEDAAKGGEAGNCRRAAALDRRRASAFWAQREVSDAAAHTGAVAALSAVRGELTMNNYARVCGDLHSQSAIAVFYDPGVQRWCYGKRRLYVGSLDSAADRAGFCTWASSSLDDMSFTTRVPRELLTAQLPQSAYNADQADNHRHTQGRDHQFRMITQHAQECAIEEQGQPGAHKQPLPVSVFNKQ